MAGNHANSVVNLAPDGLFAVGRLTVHRYHRRMASKKKHSGAFQICIRHRLLPRPFWATFDDRAQAASYASQLELLLSQGIVRKRRASLPITHIFRMRD